MTIKLYGNWISTFARKVALGIELKGLTYEPIDALAPEFHDELVRLNPRAEVPVLTDDGITVVNSSDILQYLEWRYPQPALYPADIGERVAARTLERLHDQRFDPIVVDCSLWQWAHRNDKQPAGLQEAGQRDIERVFARLETELAARPKPWPFGAPGVVECAWFANLIAARPLGFEIDEARFPFVVGWLRAMRVHPVFNADAKRTAAFLKTRTVTSEELRRIFWSGDRIEWLLGRGFQGWFMSEIEAGRVAFADG
jgi:glutathione S-transferase